MSESSSLQQVFRDLINAFNKFFNENAGYPKFKSKKNPKQSFRIQNNHNIKFKNNVVVFPKIGSIYFRTSKKYKKILTSDDTKINNVTIKRHNGKYYAVFNVKTSIMMFDKTFESVGVDLGLRTLATLSNELEKANIDVTYEDEMIHKYQRKLARKKPGSKRYKNTLQTYWKWVDKKTNKIKHAQHQISHNLAKYYDIICMENLDVKGMFENKNISSILQSTGLTSLVEKIKYKCEWHDKEFIQISRWFPSSKKCHNCGYIHHNLKDEKTWTCPKCGKNHDRDINASKNILQEGKRILREKIMNLWCREDSTVILEAIASTAREVRILEVYTSR